MFLAAIGFLCLLPAANAQRQVSSRDQTSVGQSARGTDLGSFFPLETGNEWTYSDGTREFTVKVLRETEEANGLRYFEVSGYFPEDNAKVRKLRPGRQGQILEYNPAGEDFLWYVFSLRQGVWNFQTQGPIPCVTGSQVGMVNAAVPLEVPAGAFQRTLKLDFRAPCADAGILSEYFAGGVGLVQRVLETIAGPRTVRLVAAHLGPSHLPETAFGITVSLDRPVYFNNLMPPAVNPWPTAKARLIVRNMTELPVEFTFATSQRFDFLVRDAKGREVLRWSDGQAFLQVAGKEAPHNASLSYLADIVLRGRDGKQLPAGFYTIEGYLTTRDADAGLMMVGTVTFEIRDIH